MTIDNKDTISMSRLGFKRTPGTHWDLPKVGEHKELLLVSHS